MCDSWKPDAWVDTPEKRKQHIDNMYTSMRDFVSEYSDEKHGMLIMEQHLKKAAKDLHDWHAEKTRDLSNFIANLEITS